MIVIASGLMACPMVRVDWSILMEAVTRGLSSRECPAGKVDLSARKGGTTRDNFSRNKHRGKEFLPFRALDIDIRASGKEIFPMAEVNKLGLNLVP